MISLTLKRIGLGARRVTSRWPMRILRIALLGGCYAALSALVVPVAPASAATIYVLQPGSAFPFNPPGGFGELWGVAEDQSSHLVYVSDRGDAKIDKFSTVGNPLAFSALGSPQISVPDDPALYHLAVDNSGGPSTGDIYVADLANHRVDKYDPSGEPDPATPFIGAEILETPTGVAVDSSGDVFVTNSKSDGAVYEFSPSGGLLNTIGSGDGLNGPEGVAVAPSGAIYVAATNGTFEFNQSGACLNNCGPIESTRDNAVSVDKAGDVFIADNTKKAIDEYSASGELLETFASGGGGVGAEPGGIVVDNETADVYAVSSINDTVQVYAPVVVPTATTGSAMHAGRTSVTLTGEVNPVGGGEVTECNFEYGKTEAYGHKIPCSPSTPYSGSGPTEVSAELTELDPASVYHYRLVAGNEKGAGKGHDQSVETLPAVTGLLTQPASNISITGASLNGTFTGNAEDTHYYFEWGTTEAYGNVTELPPGTDAGSPSGEANVSADLSGLSPATEYDYRIVASNLVGSTVGQNQKFETHPLPPVISGEVSTEVHSDTAIVHAQINPGGGPTTYRVEYVDDATFKESGFEHATKAPIPDAEIGTGFSALNATVTLRGLSATTTYHWRFAATNLTTTTFGAEQTFNTFSYIPIIEDSCPNAHVRQQTGAAYLLDCRAYELVSAGNAGGYDVESNLVAGQTPFSGFPYAESPPRVLYGVNDGGIPGTNHPTNKGIDPYVATRGEKGWTTEYIGVPADNPFSIAPFSSTPSGADATLDTFAFGEPGGCSPCFEGGYTSIPLRVPGSPELIRGMIGSEEPGPEAQPDGLVRVPVSADGDHLIFGSTSEFAPGGNDSTGDVSIYDRNLATGETHVVSDNPNGEPLPCLKGTGKCDTANKDSNGIAELDVSSDGSHVLLGQKVSEEKGTIYWRLFMDINDAERTIELTPGATDGVIYHGMSSDGSDVFFTTNDALTTAGNQDTDTSADLYEAEVSETGATLTRISTGAEGTGNTNACEPVANANGKHWNSSEVTPNCSVLAIGGNGGVVSEAGSVFFLSPEQLEAGRGVQNQPNLYLGAPGQSPRFVATLSPNDQLVIDSLKEPETLRTADFQATPSGRFAAISTIVPLTGYANSGHSEIFRYDSSENQITCVSCDPTNAEAAGDASLAADGLSLTEAGRIFFNSTDALAPHDLDNVQDVYEWEPQGTGNCGPESPNFSSAFASCTGLISTGTSPFASGLLSASANGTDVYFFTRDTLVPQDKNGELVKIYDARSGGGFPYMEPPTLCKASDECHGAGTPAPPAPQIGSTATPGQGNEEVKSSTQSVCKRGFVNKHAHCVPKPRHPRKPKTHRRGKK